MTTSTIGAVGSAVLVMLLLAAVVPVGHRRPVELAPTARSGTTVAGSASTPARHTGRTGGSLGPRRSRRITPAAVAAWCDELARSLRHGATLRAALTAVAPDDEPLARQTQVLRRHIDRGASVRDACDRWADALATGHRPDADIVETVAAVLGAAATVGGSAAAPIDRCAAAMRQHTSDELERDAQSAQARMSARVLTIVPVAVLALLLTTDDGVREVVTKPAGATAVGVGLGLNVAGAWWMRRIVDRSSADGGSS